MTKEELLGLRKQITDNLLPLVLEGNRDPVEQSDLLLMALRSSDDRSLYGKAFEVINKIEDKDQKADYLLRLLDEVEAGIESIDENEQDNTLQQPEADAVELSSN